MAEIVQEFYSDFINVEPSTLLQLMTAASFLQIQPLVDLTCATVAATIKGKTPEEIRKYFNIVDSDDDDTSLDDDEEKKEEK